MSTKDAYTKRKSHSIAAPIEVDSDSDFAPGAYVPEVKPKKKARTSLAGPSRKKRKLDASEKKSAHSKGTKKRYGAEGSDSSNALLQYFAEDLDLHSASEDEVLDDPMIDGPSRASDSEEHEKDDEEEPVQSQTLAGFIRREAGSKSQSPMSSSNPKPGAVNEEDSVTESESDNEAPPKSSLPTNIPSRNGNLKPPATKDDTSVTESETESESEVDSKPGPSAPLKPPVSKKMPQQKSPPKASSDSEDSVTESESEPEVDKNHKLRPKPGFDLRPDQKYEKALVLDAETGTKVPAAINTYLRDYQRDGVKFLWRQYKEGRGGLLGDDMGLVKLSKSYPSSQRS
ncbi:hypothetical protein BDZ97DRAFT_325051 [Flammula alnicola]|nr:hypothetical protein BDZ97DRAFT_325051 [Flammula alnicola]